MAGFLYKDVHLRRRASRANLHVRDDNEGRDQPAQV
jgi:hypothetical protein